MTDASDIIALFDKNLNAEREIAQATYLASLKSGDAENARIYAAVSITLQNVQLALWRAIEGESPSIP